MAIAGYAAFARMYNIPGSDAFENLVLGILCTVLAILSFKKYINPEKKANYNPRVVHKNSMSKSDSSLNIEGKINEVGSLTELPIVSTPYSVVLHSGEVCHYQDNASVLVIKNEVVGHTRGSGGVSVRVAKGLTLHSGSSRGTSIRQDVSYKYPGLFTMTNQRIIMTGEKGFDQPIGKLTSMVPYNGFQGITLQFGKSSYTILMAEPFWVPKIVELLQSPVYPSNNEKKQEITEISAKKVVDIEFDSIDPDDGIETPDNAEISYLDAQALEFWNNKRTDYEIPKYYEESAFGRNVEPALHRLLDGDYLEICGLEKRVSLKTIPELKAVLTDYELKTSGKKGELVQRILNNISPDELEEIFPVGIYQITEKGFNALKPYSILELNRKYSLGLSYYRLLQEKSKHPDQEDTFIISRLLSEDIQKCYEEDDKSTYQRILSKTAMFYNGNGDSKSALECYCLSFFVWTREIEEYSIQSGNTQSYYMAKEIEDVGKICGMPLSAVIDFFEKVIQSKNPFLLGNDKNINYAISIFKNALSIN